MFCDFDQLKGLEDVLQMIPKTAPLDTLWHSCPSKVRRTPRRTFSGKELQTPGVEFDTLEHVTWIQVYKCTNRMVWDLTHRSSSS